MHFGYTIVYVPDVPAAIAFYEAAFGFSSRFVSPDSNYAELDTGDTTLSFAHTSMADVLGVSLTAATPDTPAPGIEIAFVTEEVEIDFARAVSAGALVVTEPHTVPWGQVVSYVRDLNGVLVEICSPVSA
jgi:lactoylglutathione lyase